MVFQRFNLFPHMTALENVMDAGLAALIVALNPVATSAIMMATLGHRESRWGVAALVLALIVGLGWTGSILGMELSQEGLDIVALERGELHAAPELVAHEHRERAPVGEDRRRRRRHDRDARGVSLRAGLWRRRRRLDRTVRLRVRRRTGFAKGFGARGL